MEHQTETSLKLDLLVRIWGMAEGRPFFQNVHTQEISRRGAKLSGIEHHLAPGDVIGIQVGDKKSRVKVMWVIDAGQTHKNRCGNRNTRSATLSLGAGIGEAGKTCGSCAAGFAPTRFASI